MAKKVKKIETDEEKKARYENPTEHFFWLNRINTKKKIDNLDTAINMYPPYMVNKGLSYYQDTILIANEMNKNPHLHNKMQFDFMYSEISKSRNRYESWIKPEKEELILSIQECYSVSRAVAREMFETINVMNDSEELINNINERIYRGGKMGTARNT